MPKTSADARKWLEGFDAAERAEREVKRARGPQRDWSITVATSLIDGARLAASSRPLVDPRRAVVDENVRQIWSRLRAHFQR
jgi:hypothetical protein